MSYLVNNQSSFMPQVPERKGLGGRILEGVFGPYKLAVHNLRVAWKGDTSVKVDTVTNRVFRAAAGEPPRIKAGGLRRVGHALLGIASFLPLVNYIPYGLTLLFYTPKNPGYEVLGDEDDAQDSDRFETSSSNLSSVSEAQALGRNPNLIRNQQPDDQLRLLMESKDALAMLPHANSDVQKKLFMDSENYVEMFSHASPEVQKEVVLERKRLFEGDWLKYASPGVQREMVGEKPEWLMFASPDIQMEVLQASPERRLKELDASVQYRFIEANGGDDKWLKEASDAVQALRLQRASPKVQKELIAEKPELLKFASPAVRAELS